MGAKPAPTALLQRWTHSHEEDTDAGHVYRPASYAFPPSRGRASFEIKADGTMAGETPGPTDRPMPAGGRWQYRDDESSLTFYAKGSPEPIKVLRIVSVNKKKLVVK